MKLKSEQRKTGESKRREKKKPAERTSPEEANRIPSFWSSGLRVGVDNKLRGSDILNLSSCLGGGGSPPSSMT